MSKIKIKKGDIVSVSTGNSKGLKGKVIKIFPSKNMAMVEGVNLVSRHTKPNAANPQGGIIKQEAKIHISNLVMLDPKTGEKLKLEEELMKKQEN